MRLTDLRIDDFGCFRNARLETLDADLVVIGGPQRAGKTTFMEALRQFPDGVDRSDGVPPATDAYRIDAELSHDGARYRYVLNGHASPSVSPIDDGPAVDADAIFGPVTERQYRNLYTISLDELRRLPPGIDDADDLARVLLGGAYGDIAEIPEIEATFADGADAIGLSRGNPNTKTSRLYDPYQTVRDGIEARNEASRQVDEHRTVTQELDARRADQAEIEADIDRRRRTRNRLTVLEELFEPVRRLETLSARLDEVDRAAVESFPTHLTDRLDHFEARFEAATDALAEARRDFDRRASIETTGEYDEWLLAHADDIESLAAGRPLWAQTADRLAERRATLETRERELERAVAAQHSDWDGSFAHVDEVATSAVDTARVTDIASTVEELRADRDEVAAALEADRTRKAELESELAEMESEREGTREIPVPTRKPALVAGFAIAVGTGLGLATTPLVGGLVGLALLGVGLYAIDSTVSVEPTVDVDPYREVKSQVATLQGDIEAASQRRADLETQLEDAEDDLTELVTRLGLPAELPPGEVPDFYERVVELDDDIAAFRGDRADWKREKAELASDLEAVATLLDRVTEPSWTVEDPLAGADELLATLETVAADLELARDVRRAETERADCIADIDTVLTEWDEARSIDASANDDRILRHIRAFTDEAERVGGLEDAFEERDRLRTQVETRLETASARAVFEPLRDDEPWVDVVREAAATYPDTEAIADAVREANDRIDELETKREAIRETCVELEQRRDALASEDELQAAQAKIDEGRVEFERLGEAYAVNRIAEAMVGQLHERLLEDVVHSLVADASAIFSEITGAYEGIELDGGVQDLSFRALRPDGPAHGIGELSRATAEQLFLAVRLARIRQTDASLPVVLDDAATNFDPTHLQRVFAVLDQLSATNQVFFLTCHPQCVRTTAATGRTAQYWSLDDGRFAAHETADSLARVLAAD
ncbi:AAA family ATPase [Halovivax limisalsi]|uniref:AAA family ATPase n=1 Tax=Halovivax limisalsi TaxID=1453760 RepID=UPI001FFCC000|nr:AAA family ATPase [Halovivax limisalsi]